MAKDNVVEKYELTVIFHPDLDEEGVKNECAKIEAACTAHKGEVLMTDHWGRRPLSYPIKKKQYGVYVLFVLAGDSSLVSDLSRQLRINDQVLRFLAVKKDKFAPDLQHRSGRDRLDDDAFAGIGVGDLDASDEVSL